MTELGSSGSASCEAIGMLHGIIDIWVYVVLLLDCREDTPQREQLELKGKDRQMRNVYRP
jgi:hypothetical protein